MSERKRQIDGTTRNRQPGYVQMLSHPEVIPKERSEECVWMRFLAAVWFVLIGMERACRRDEGLLPGALSSRPSDRSSPIRP